MGRVQQVFVDLLLALGVAWALLWQDARARRIPAWPYLVATLALGSTGVLANLHREVLGRRAATGGA